MILDRCGKSYFDVIEDKSTPYDGASIFDGLFGTEVKEGVQIIDIYYKNEKTYVEEEELRILSLWGFISSCGGTFGLFIGFSFYGTITSILDMIKESGYTTSK